MGVYMKKILMLIMIVALVFFALGCEKADTQEMNTSENEENYQTDIIYEGVKLNEDNVYISKYASISKEEWESVETANTRYATVEDFLTEIDYYVEEIVNILDRDDFIDVLYSQENERNRRIEFKFTTEDISHASGGEAQFDNKFTKPVVLHNDTLFESGWMMIAHELTHIIAPYSKSVTLREGLASYIQEEVSLNNGQFKFQGELSELTIILFDEGYEYLCEYLGNTENGKNKLYTTDRGERMAYYAISLSFTDFIVTNYGLEEFMELYSSECDNEAYAKVFNMDRDELIKDFKESIQEI